MPCAYIIENLVNGKLYVGYTKGDFMSRWKRHQLAAAHGYQTYFVYALRKYGVVCFKPTAVFECDSAEEAKCTEMFLISLLGTRDASIGYNLTAGGEGLINPTPEVRQKISRAGMGRVPSLETRQKISEARMGNCHWLGRKHSEETKAKMRQSAMGNKNAEGKRYNMSNQEREARRTRMLGNSLWKCWINKETIQCA